MTAAVELLLQRATWAHPASKSHRTKWVKAARYLRSRGLWVLDAKTTRKDAA